jgi:cytochrome c
MKKQLVFGVVMGAVLMVGATSAMAADAAEGEKVYAACKACHSLEPGKKGVGPSLAGIYGRKAGTSEGFAYSEAMKAYGAAWDETTLKAYIENPKGAIPGNKMAYAGLKDATKMADLLAFLKTK